MDGGTRDDALQETCAAIDRTIAALQAEIDRGVTVERKAALMMQISSLQQRKTLLGCDTGQNWDDLEIPPPSEAVVEETVTLMRGTAGRIRDARDGDTLIAIARDIIDKADRLKGA